MIAFLSNSIEIAVSAFATGLLSVFPFLPSSIVTHPEQIMVTIGFAGQGLFAMRFIVQWLTSEGQGRSVIPIAFWYFSIGGGTVLLLADEGELTVAMGIAANATYLYTLVLLEDGTVQHVSEGPD